MGQYHHIVNLDKREFLYSHDLGVGLKLWEQFGSYPSTPQALFLLLVASNGRGGGDFNDHEGHELIGSWAGDRIAVIGDYAEATDLPPEFEADKIYERCSSTRYPDSDVPKSEQYRDITADVRKLMEELLARTGWRYEISPHGIGDWVNGSGGGKAKLLAPDMVIGR